MVKSKLIHCVRHEHIIGYGRAAVECEARFGGEHMTLDGCVGCDRPGVGCEAGFDGCCSTLDCCVGVVVEVRSIVGCVAWVPLIRIGESIDR